MNPIPVLSAASPRPHNTMSRISHQEDQKVEFEGRQFAHPQPAKSLQMVHLAKSFSIPVGILKNIGSYLPHKDYIRLFRTARRFKIALDTDAFWRHYNKTFLDYKLIPSTTTSVRKAIQSTRWQMQQYKDQVKPTYSLMTALLATAPWINVIFSNLLHNHYNPATQREILARTCLLDQIEEGERKELRERLLLEGRIKILEANNRNWWIATASAVVFQVWNIIESRRHVPQLLDHLPMMAIIPQSCLPYLQLLGCGVFICVPLVKACSTEIRLAQLKQRLRERQ